jgi:hypothetical protein
VGRALAADEALGLAVELEPELELEDELEEEQAARTRLAARAAMVPAESVRTERVVMAEWPFCAPGAGDSAVPIDSPHWWRPRSLAPCGQLDSAKFQLSFEVLASILHIVETRATIRYMIDIFL